MGASEHLLHYTDDVLFGRSNLDYHICFALSPSVHTRFMISSLLIIISLVS